MFEHEIVASLQRKIKNQKDELADLHVEITELKKEIERLKAERGWISVNDRLPEKNGKYLCYLVHDDPKLDSRMAVIFRNNSWSTVIGDNWIKTHSITHWMPLPEPPKQ